ncbi:hypothetical protein BH20ACT14_BH20ACT14_09340 [soil metagenome]
MARGRYGSRHLVDLVVAEGAAVQKRAAVADDRDHRRVSEPERLGELLLDCAGRALQLGERERAASDSGDCLLDLASYELRKPLRACTHLLHRLVEHAQHGNSVTRLRRESERECPFERGQGQLVRPERALQRMAAQPLHEFGSSDDDACLRPTQKLVSREANEVRPGPQALGRSRLVPDSSQRPRAEIVDERHVVLAGELGQLVQARLLREADDPKVRLVHPEQDRGLRPNRPLVV